MSHASARFACQMQVYDFKLAKAERDLAALPNNTGIAMRYLRRLLGLGQCSIPEQS